MADAQEIGQVTLEDGSLSFLIAGIRVRDARLAVVVLVGEDENEVLLEPGPAQAGHMWIRDTPAGRVRCRSTQWTFDPGFTLTWIVGQFEHRPGVLLEARFCNRTEEPVRLRDLVLLRTAERGVEVPGDPADWWLMSYTGQDDGHLGQILPSKNERTREMWKGFGMPVPHELSADAESNDGRWRLFRDFVTLYTGKGERGLACAAVGKAADIDLDWYVEGDRCRLEIASRMSDVVVDPGECRSSDTAVVLGGPYAETVDSILRWIASTCGSRTHRPPIVGWCSWYDLGPRISAEHTIDVAQAAQNLRQRLPMDVIQIDDGFQRQAGDWECNDSFPAGWQPVVEAIHDAKATPGIWLAPLVVHERAGGVNYTCTDGTLLEVHPDWFQRTAKGELAHQGGNWGATSYWIDPTHPEVQQFLRRIVRRMRQEGFRYFKIDFNTVSENARLHDPKKTRLQAYRDLYRLYREEMGEDAYLLSCSQLTRATIGYADASRIGPDSAPQWHAPHPCCIRDSIRAVGGTAWANDLFYANDPDVTYMLPRGDLTLDELRTWHAFVGLLGGLAMVSEPLDRDDYQTEDALRMLEILTPPAAEKGRPFHPGIDKEHRRFGFVAERPWGPFAALLVYNPGEESADLALDVAHSLEALGDHYHAWSFWDGSYLGIIDGSYAVADLAPHASKLLRLTALAGDEQDPVLIGSDLHISMGAAEIDEVRITARSCTLVLGDAGARSGSLWLYSRQPLRLEAAEGMGQATLSKDGQGIWQVAIENRHRGVRQAIHLAVGAEGEHSP